MSNVFDICKVCFTFGKPNFTNMKSHLLFPARFRYLGALLAAPGFVLGFLFLFYNYTIPGFGKYPDQHNNIPGVFENYTNELALVLIVAGLLLIAFSKMKNEDELTASIRLNALYWAIFVNYLLYITWVIYEVAGLAFNTWLPDYISPMAQQFIMYNLFMPLVIFILRFYYLVYRTKSEYKIAPLHFLPYKPFYKIAKILSVLCIIIAIPLVVYSFLNNSWFLITVNESAWVMYSDGLYYIMPFILLLWVYSKERKEDEYISTIRLEAMQIAVYANYAILLVSNFFFFSLDFLLIQILNLSTIPLIFIIVFQSRLLRLSWLVNDKKNNSLNLNIL